MQTELRHFIEETRFHRASVLRVVEMLPAGDEGLDELIAELVLVGDKKGFLLVVVAALSRERPVNARHLVQGTRMLQNYIWLGAVAARLEGEVAEDLLAAVTQTQLSRECEAAALLLAAAWSQEHREGNLPERLIPTARILARQANLPVEAQGMLIALAVRVQDSALLSVVRLIHSAKSPEQWKTVEDSAVKFGEGVLTASRKPILELMEAKPSNVLANGTTMRRAVTRIGRNEPCPCGSGRKYKHCCQEADQQRLQHSSEVAGLTQEELNARPETHLTQARLDRADASILQRLDPTKIPPELLEPYFFRVGVFHLFDCAAAAFEKLGYSEALHGSWEAVLFFAARAGHKDCIRRLVDLREDPDNPDAEVTIHPAAALVLWDDDPAQLIKLLEEYAMYVLHHNVPEVFEKLANALMFSRFRGLGILVGRGTLPLLPQDSAGRVFNQILETRDKLNLSPEDPFGDIMDERFAALEDDQKKESAQLRKAQQNLNVKAQEVRQLKESLGQLQKEISLRELKRSAAPQPARVAAPAPGEEPTLKELRQKVESLKSALKERHHERNQLRRDLLKTHTDLEQLRQNAATAPSEDLEGQDCEEELLLPQDAVAVHPVRLIGFPKSFKQTLDRFPLHVARAAMIMAGRLAAGEPAAFVGALRLKATPDVMRQRIGSDFRLLFQLWPDRLEVIDLINRKDLDRRLRRLG